MTKKLFFCSGDVWGWGSCMCSGGGKLLFFVRVNYFSKAGLYDLKILL